MSMGASPTLSKTETIISCEKGHIELTAASEDQGGWRLTVHEEDQAPFHEYVRYPFPGVSPPNQIVAGRRFPSRGVYEEIRSFSKDIHAVQAGHTTATSKTAEKALRDLAVIEACVRGTAGWIEIDSMR